MTATRRLIVLRVLAIVALAASGALIADALRPERGFCPLEAACSKARSSALGTILGVPTSSIGALAFAALLGVTFLPPRLAHRFLRPAGFLAAASGTVFLGFQVVVLGSICPFCLVADVAGIGAGAAVIGWNAPPAPKKSKSKATKGGKKRRVVKMFVETASVRLRWAMAAFLAFAAPFLWPHEPPRPSWVPRPQVAFAEYPPPAPATSGLPAVHPPEPPADVRTPPAPPLPPVPVRSRAREGEVPDPAGRTGRSLPEATPRIEPLPGARATPPPSASPPAPPIDEPAPSAAVTHPEPSAPDPPSAAAPPPSSPAPSDPPHAEPRDPVVVVENPPPVASPPVAAAETPRPAASAPPAAAPATLTMIEYLNPFCAHCRATHARLERLLETSRAPVRRQRVYVWATGDPPLWAKAIACAQAMGGEHQLFSALVHGPIKEDDRVVWAAVSGAGLDRNALAQCIARGDWQGRLQWERSRVMQSQIEGLPTFDIGRRRLQGEQSEAELRDALDAALQDLGLPKTR